MQPTVSTVRFAFRNDGQLDSWQSHYVPMETATVVNRKYATVTASMIGSHQDWAHLPIKKK